MSTTIVSTIDVDGIARRALLPFVRGEVIFPSDPRYETARRIWNGRIDRRPALIVRPAGAADVIAALDFAGSLGLPLTVRGGGHGVAGKAVAAGGLMIDFGGMKEARVDPLRGVAWAEPGLTWGELNAATGAYGLATPGGKVASVGIAGSTLGGGIGWLVRKHGLTIDNLLAVDVVTAKGELLTASEREHPDLFWGVRGGGGNLGIATSFKCCLHPVGTVLAGVIAYPLVKAREVMAVYRDVIATAPDELTSVAALMTAPDGRPVIAIAVTYAGDLAAGERVIAPLLAYGPPAMTQVAPMPYGALQAELAKSATPGVKQQMKSGFVASFSDDLIGLVADAYAAAPTPNSLIMLEHYGGAAGRVAVEATAYPHRDGEFNLVIEAGWREKREEERAISWTQELWRAARPFTTGGVYSSLLDADDAARIPAAYGVNYARLAALKRRYDPDNVFRHNANVPPSP